MLNWGLVDTESCEHYCPGGECSPDGVALHECCDEVDAPAHCAHCGALLSAPLTREGAQYVRERVRAGRGRPEVLEEWREEYAHLFADDADDEPDNLSALAVAECLGYAIGADPSIKRAPGYPETYVRLQHCAEVGAEVDRLVSAADDGAIDWMDVTQRAAVRLAWQYRNGGPVDPAAVAQWAAGAAVLDEVAPAVRPEPAYDPRPRPVRDAEHYGRRLRE